MLQDRATPPAAVSSSTPELAPTGPVRGRLRLFVGYAPGVGKTSRLVHAARELARTGRNVLVGYLGALHEPALEAMAAELPTAPRRRVVWRGLAVEEMSFDEVLARRPEVVVVDELAHTNLPGSVHRRRYQDVVALLDAGIDVLGALDIQHLESLNELVSRVVQLKVRETVPDGFFRDADEWMVIDLPADELKARATARAGTATTPAISARADEVAALSIAQLTLLREMALREVAEALDRRARRGAPSNAEGAPRAATADRHEAGRVLVGMSTFPARVPALLRRGSLLAGRLNTTWFVVYVETPETRPSRLDEESTRQLFANIELGRELGAEVVRLESGDPAAALLDFARAHGVGHILIGRSRTPWWRQILGQSVALRLVREGAGFDILIAAREDESA